jgi:hypothetical protein
MEVLPALSRPSSKIRTSLSLFLSFRNKDNRPYNERSRYMCWLTFLGDVNILPLYHFVKRWQVRDLLKNKDMGVPQKVNRRGLEWCVCMNLVSGNKIAYQQDCFSLLPL